MPPRRPVGVVDLYTSLHGTTRPLNIRANIPEVEDIVNLPPSSTGSPAGFCEGGQTYEADVCYPS